jgi:DnaK suppressor protein
MPGNGSISPEFSMSKKNLISSNRSKESSMYRRVLLERRNAVLTGLATKVSDLAKVGRVGEEDQAQWSHEEAVSLRLNGIGYLQLRQVQEALDRLENGDFGICISCEERIAAKRLQVLPWAKYCVKCQEKIAEAPSSHSGSREDE